MSPHACLPRAPCRSTGCLQVCCGRNCGLLLGTAQGRRHRKKLDLRLVNFRFTIADRFSFTGKPLNTTGLPKIRSQRRN